MRIRTAFFVAAATSVAACGADTAEEVPASEAPVATETSATTTLLDPNEAERAARLGVEGLGEDAVDALVAGRPFTDMLQVDAVLADHMDEAGREVVYASVWKPLDLNEASGQEILLIPGVGERMEHEFEEYRPYRAMAEFHREIGKYVDEDEVMRLAAYVEIR